MITVYVTDEQGVYVESAQVDPFDALPPRSVLTAPPITVGQQVALWANGGWVVLPQRPPAQTPVVPFSVSRRQGRQALLLAGKLALVQPAIDAIADATQRGLAQIYWDDSQEFERNHPTLISLAAQIGLTSADLDLLFITAGALQ